MNKPELPSSNSETESVWDYPRPPRLEPAPRRIRILSGDHTVADSTRALRILETSHPPVYYIPPADIAMGLLRRTTARGSFCEFKGVASYWTLHLPQASSESIIIPDVAWSYEAPDPDYEPLAQHLAFYASRLAQAGVTCWVGDEHILPQEGDFYGGWITSDLRGPFKGAPGTRGW